MYMKNKTWKTKRMKCDCACGAVMKFLDFGDGQIEIDIIEGNNVVSIVTDTEKVKKFFAGLK